MVAKSSGGAGSRLMPGPTKNIIMFKTPKIILKAKKKEFVCFGLEPQSSGLHFYCFHKTN